MPPTLGPESESSAHAAAPLGGLNPAAEASMFNNAANIRIKDSSLYNIQHTTIVNPGSGLEALYRQVARNAIWNTGGRAEDAKCHPGTRVEVIDLIERWMDDTEGVSRMFWLSGPAGAGKTAIVKTVAERCKDRGVHTTNFFFFRGDPTRNLVLPLVATLVYQILQVCPAAHDAVARILAINPLILQASVNEQFDELIHPLLDIISKSPSKSRVVLLVDGLDECDVDASLDQARTIQALSSLATRPHSPFLVLIASRPEARIQIAFNQLSSKVHSIFLDEKYSPQKDIRLFVNEEFEKIKLSHPNAASLPHDWPSASDVEGIVAKSSGQFIYAATVMRYIAYAAAVPSLSLERVKGIVPSANNSPFTHLDSIYSFIFSQVDNLEATRTILSMKILLVLSLTIGDDVDILLQYDSCYTEALVQSCVTELSAIICLIGSSSLEFYHASMTDFLLDRSRSGVYWIDINAFREKVLMEIWYKTFDYTGTLNKLLYDLEKPSVHITRLLVNSPFPDWTMATFTTQESESRLHFLNTIHKLYYSDDLKTYKCIVRRFVYFSLSSNNHPHVTDIPYAQKYLSRYDRYAWWFKLANLPRRKK